jgi:hypothetical protein
MVFPGQLQPDKVYEMLAGFQHIGEQMQITAGAGGSLTDVNKHSIATCHARPVLLPCPAVPLLVGWMVSRCLPCCWRHWWQPQG